MKIGFVSLGCPKNLVDSEVMLGLAEQAGHEITADAAGAGAPPPTSPVTFHRPSPRFGIDLPDYLYDATTPRRLATPGHYAYLKIAEGCDYKCAFCIIPKMRGHYRSRTSASILQEARQLAARGVKE